MHESHFYHADLRAAGRQRNRRPQQTAARRAANGVVKFQANTQLVVETVTVKDKNGKPVEGLTAKDFTITEDGVPQTISFCEFQKLDERRPADADGRPDDTPAPATRRPRRSRRSRCHGAPDCAGDAGRHTLSRPAADGAVLRHDRDAGARPVPRAKPRREVHQDADAAGGPDGDHGVQRRRRAGAAGFHRQDATTW